MLTGLAQTAGGLDLGRAELSRGPRHLDTPRWNPVASTRSPTGTTAWLRSRRVVSARTFAVFDAHSPGIATSRRPAAAAIVAVRPRLAVAARSPITRPCTIASRRTPARAGRPVVCGRRTFARIAVAARSLSGIPITARRATTTARVGVSPGSINGLVVVTRSIGRRRSRTGATRRRSAGVADAARSALACSADTLAGALTRACWASRTLRTARFCGWAAVVGHRCSSLGPNSTARRGR